jgi:hypothetical protein
MPTVTTPGPNDVEGVVLGGTLEVSDAEIGDLVDVVVQRALPALVGALGPIDLPTIPLLPPFHPVEVTSVGGYLAGFVDFNDPPWFVEPVTDLFVTIQPGGFYELQVVAQDGEAHPQSLTVDVFPADAFSWGFTTPAQGVPRTLSTTFSFFGDVVGRWSFTFTVTDEHGLVAQRFLTIQVCEDPNAVICELL